MIVHPPAPEAAATKLRPYKKARMYATRLLMKYRRISAAVAALALALALDQGASASPWAYITKGSDGAIVEGDLGTLRNSDGIMRLWIRHDYSKAKKENGRYLMTLVEVDCTESTSRTLSSALYGSGESVISNSDTPFTSFARIVPGSSSDAIRRSVCEASDTGQSTTSVPASPN